MEQCSTKKETMADKLKIRMTAINSNVTGDLANAMPYAIRNEKDGAWTRVTITLHLG